MELDAGTVELESTPLPDQKLTRQLSVKPTKHPLGHPTFEPRHAIRIP